MALATAIEQMLDKGYVVSWTITPPQGAPSPSTPRGTAPVARGLSPFHHISNPPGFGMEDNPAAFLSHEMEADAPVAKNKGGRKRAASKNAETEKTRRPGKNARTEEDEDVTKGTAASAPVALTEKELAKKKKNDELNKRKREQRAQAKAMELEKAKQAQLDADGATPQPTATPGMAAAPDKPTGEASAIVDQGKAGTGAVATSEQKQTPAPAATPTVPASTPGGTSGSPAAVPGYGLKSLPYMKKPTVVQKPPPDEPESDEEASDGKELDVGEILAPKPPVQMASLLRGVQTYH